MSLTSWRKSLEQILGDKVSGLDNFSQVLKKKKDKQTKLTCL